MLLLVFMLIYTLLSVLLFAGFATLVCRLLSVGRLRSGPALLYGSVAFLLLSGISVLAPLRSLQPIVVAFIALLAWGTLFFLRWPRRTEGGGFEQSFVMSLLVAGLYVLACIAGGAFLIWLEGPAMAGGG